MCDLEAEAVTARRTRKPVRRKLLQLVYASSAARALSAEDVQTIVARSLVHNVTEGLTGLLLYRGAAFHAVLEGPTQALLARMEVIITDPRHRDLRILREQTVESRRFANWSFAALPGTVVDLGAVHSGDEFGRALAARLR